VRQQAFELELGAAHCGPKRLDDGADAKVMSGVARHAAGTYSSRCANILSSVAEDHLVDVGIPTRGRPRFLAQAIECVLAQTYGSWRLIISENAAEGAVAEIVEAYAGDPRIRYVSTQERFANVAKAQNVVYSLGNAPYVALLHDDDLWDPEFLERRVEAFEQTPDCGYVFGGNRIIDEEGRELSRTKPALAGGVHAPTTVVPLLLRNDAVPQAPTAMIRRAAFNAVGGAYDERFERDDQEMYLRLALRFPVHYLDVWDSSFRIHAGQLSYQTVTGESTLTYEEHVDALVRRELPEARLPEGERRRRRASALVTATVDALLDGDHDRARARLSEAVRVRPASLVNPRVAVALPAFVLGGPWRRLLLRARVASRKRDYLRGLRDASQSRP
jgi:hypothetical protein